MDSPFRRYFPTQLRQTNWSVTNKFQAQSTTLQASRFELRTVISCHLSIELNIKLKCKDGRTVLNQIDETSKTQI